MFEENVVRNPLKASLRSALAVQMWESPGDAAKAAQLSAEESINYANQSEQIGGVLLPQ